MTVLEIAKAKLAHNTSITEPSIVLAIDEVEQAIKNYCNIVTIPEGLMYVHANMSVELAQYQYELTNPVTDVDIDLGDISNVKIGDTNIALQGGGGTSQRAKTLKSHRPNLDEITLNYRAQLNKYRRMPW